MNFQKKTYQSPKLTEYGTVEAVTQNLFSPGTGDILSDLVPDSIDGGRDSGCLFSNSPVCPPSTGS